MFKLINSRTFYKMLKTKRAAPGYYGSHKRRFITFKYKGEILNIEEARKFYFDIIIDELKHYVGSKVKYLGSGKSFNAGDPKAHYFFYDLTSITCDKPVYALLILYKGIENDPGHDMVVFFDEDETYTFGQTNNFVLAMLTSEHDVAFIGAAMDKNPEKYHNYIASYLQREWSGDAENVVYVNFNGEGSDEIERME